jgi:predicted transcriptional regulator
MNLGALELEILSLLRLRGEMTATEIQEALRQSRRIAYTSVTTTLYRLREKELVAARQAGGRKVLYTADLASGTGRTALAYTVGRLIDAFGEATVSHAVGEAGTLDRRELARLAREADARRKPAKRRKE